MLILINVLKTTIVLLMHVGLLRLCDVSLSWLLLFMVLGIVFRVSSVLRVQLLLLYGDTIISNKDDDDGTAGIT